MSQVRPVWLTEPQIAILREALACYEYEHAPEGANLSSGFVDDPRLDRDLDQDPLDEQERAVADFLDACADIETALGDVAPSTDATPEWRS
jgi:hypothetical protein